MNNKVNYSNVAGYTERRPRNALKMIVKFPLCVHSGSGVTEFWGLKNEAGVLYYQQECVHAHITFFIIIRTKWSGLVVPESPCTSTTTRTFVTTLVSCFKKPGKSHSHGHTNKSLISSWSQIIKMHVWNTTYSAHSQVKKHTRIPSDVKKTRVRQTRQGWGKKR